MQSFKPSELNSGFRVRVRPGGLHFFERKTGLNILIDEIKPPKSSWHKAPRHVSIALTNACDLSCSFCYAPKKVATLSFERLKRWLVELDNNGCIGVGFGGGEPTLYPLFSEICAFATEKTGLAVTMTTHAHRLNEQLLKTLFGNIHFVRVSMDGVGKTYESIRKRSFDALTERIESLREIVPFGINYVVNKQTVGEIEQAIQFASEHGASEFLLLPERPTSSTSGIEPQALSKMKNWVISYRGPVPLSISEGGADGLPTCRFVNSEQGLTAFAHIDANGTLRKTSFDLVGIPIAENDLMKALNSLQESEQEEPNT